MSGGRKVQPLKLGIVAALHHAVREDMLAALVWRPPVSFFSSPRLSALLLLAVDSWREITLAASHELPSLPSLQHI